MSVALSSANVSPSTTSRTLLYTCPATGVLDTTIFTGTISNIDTTGMATHSVTVERLLADGVTYVPKLVPIPIAFGGSLKFPKMALVANEKVYITSLDANMITVDISYAQRGA